MDILILVVIISLLIYFNFDKVEKFTSELKNNNEKGEKGDIQNAKNNVNFVPYNSFKVPINKIKSLYEEENSVLRDNFNLYINKSTQLPDYKTTFIVYPHYLDFPYNDIIKQIVVSKISDILLKHDMFKNSTFTILGNIKDIYWRDIDGNRHLIFNIQLGNKIKALTRKLVVYLIINDIKNYLTDTNEYLPITLSGNLNCTIKYINVSEENIDFSIKPLNEEYDNNIFQIKNKLHLTGPFVTNQKDGDINFMQVLNFEKKMKNPTGIELKVIDNSKCFGIKVPSFNREHCIDNGGIWESVPIDDTECPYYKSNKNYPNSFGKMNGEYCELPKNMRLLSYKEYSKDPVYKPLCYNCKNNIINQGTLGFCCDEQLDRNKYPYLLTPDYAFEGDLDLRNKYKDVLFSKKLELE